MSGFLTDAPAVTSSRSRRGAALPLLFGATILAGSCLLFLVQPLISKLILPWFGGTSAVWIACMLFFQMGLLLGYSYAHALTRFLDIRRQALVHALLLAASLAMLPIVPGAGWQLHPGEDPVWRLFGVLAASIGLPYLALSSSSPLLQSWYAAAARNALPYRYFALSNAGSLAALLAYPILIEPHLTGRLQAWSWSIAYAAFTLLCLSTALVNRSPGRRAAAMEAAAVSFPQVFFWIALAACPSALLLAVTNLLTQNIAPMPLLWVLPLSIYLLTFILCFESSRWYKRVIFFPLVFPALAFLASATGPVTHPSIGRDVGLLVGALFICCMACHGELASVRPPAPNLTAFYLCLAAGGALGGLFVGLIAPHVFPAMYEYPIVFISCPLLLLSMWVWRTPSARRRRIQPAVLHLSALALTLILAAYACRQTWFQVRSAARLARNFYGALRVDNSFSNGRQVLQLNHGTITHGLQFVNRRLSRVPTTYYGRDSGVGLTWRILERAGPLRMGIVGLGTGTLAAYGRGGDLLRFYEINPLVVDIARRNFTYLSDCPARVDIVLGDARLSLARESSQQFDILVVDAFSGDAIPVHLLTREAFQIYWRHLKPDGVLLVHVSNHYLNLAPVVSLNATAFGKQARRIENEDDDEYQVFSSTYVIATSRRNFFNHPLFAGQLAQVEIPPATRPWTDDYSNLWHLLRFNGKDD